MKKILFIMITFSALLFMSSCQKEPTACFTASKTTCYVGETINYTNCSVDASSYKWTLTDGSTNISKNLNVTYNSTGTKIIKLEVFSKNGNKTDEASMMITVNPVPTPPVTHTTDWQITIVDVDDGTPINDCTVRLYKTDDDWTNNTNTIVTGQTNSNGVVTFTNLQSIVYYVDALKIVGNCGFDNYVDLPYYISSPLTANVVNTSTFEVEYWCEKSTRTKHF